MSVTVKLAATLLVVLSAVTVLLIILAIHGDTEHERVRLGMWAAAATIAEIIGALATLALHKDDLADERHMLLKAQLRSFEQITSRRIQELRREIDAHIAVEEYHEAVGLPRSCDVRPITTSRPPTAPRARLRKHSEKG